MFLPHTVNITRIESVLSPHGSTKKSATDIYCCIPAMFWKSRSNTFSDTNLSRMTNVSSYNVVIEGDKTDVKEGDRIELINKSGVSLGLFSVGQFEENWSKRKGSSDNIHFTAYKE